MTAPDPLAVRAFRFTVEGHEKNADRALESIRGCVARLTGDGFGERITALADAQHLAVDVASLITHLSALKALTEIDFLTTDQGPGQG